MIGCSVAIHVLLIFVLLHGERPTKKSQKETPRKIINATLFVTPAKPVIVPKQPVVKPLITVNKRIVDDESNFENLANPLVKPLLEQDKAKKAKKALNKVVESSVQSNSLPEKAVTRAPSAAAILSASRRYLGSKRTELIFDKPLQRATTSLMTGTPNAHYYHVDERTIEDKRAVKITCDTTTKQIVATIAGITGGTVTCDKQPNLADFLPKARD